MHNHVRLGQRVYGVTNNGAIVPTLVSVVELTEVTKDLSDPNYHFDLGLHGPQHGEILKVKYRVLNSELQQTWLTFEVACKQALMLLERLKESDSVTVGQQKKYAKQHEQLLTQKRAIQKEVDALSAFSQSETMLSMLVSKDTEKRRYSPADFPKHYIEPGTAVWIADTKKWRLIRGHVTGVHFTAAWHRNFNYYCGSHANLDARTVFRTKRGAMNYLERSFAEKLPGDLNRKKVPIVPQVSTAEKEAQTLRKFEKMGESL